MVMIPHIIHIENYEELTPEGRGNNHVILSCKSAILFSCAISVPDTSASGIVSQTDIMPVKVYVWKPKGDDSYGHASMELSDGTYISWWPEYGGKAQRTKHKAHGFQNRTLEDDVRDEGRDADLIFIIPF